MGEYVRVTSCLTVGAPLSHQGQDPVHCGAPERDDIIPTPPHPTPHYTPHHPRALSLSLSFSRSLSMEAGWLRGLKVLYHGDSPKPLRSLGLPVFCYEASLFSVRSGVSAE